MVPVGYMRVSKADGSQVLDLQRDALLAADVETDRRSDLFETPKLAGKIIVRVSSVEAGAPALGRCASR